MTISFDWLKTLFPTTLPAAEVAALLTGSGLEVEGLEELESIPGGLRGVVLGTVLTCERHPDADKLSLTTVAVRRPQRGRRPARGSGPGRRHAVS
jgi:phenylalanyl-tRNA synthetase beta chain